MNSIKSLLVVTVLAAVTYGVYVSLNQPAAGPPPDGAPVDWNVAPLANAPVQMGAPVAPADAAPLWARDTPPQAVAQASPSPGAPVFAAQPPAAPAAVPQDIALPAAPPVADAPPAPAYPSQPAPEYPPVDASPASDATATAMAAPAASPNYESAPAAPLQDPTAAAPGAPVPAADRFDFAGLISHVNSLLNQGHVTAAQLALSESFHHFDDPGLTADQRLSLYTLLDELTGTVIYSPDHLLEQAYVVQPGDTLDRVANAYSVPWQLLAKINALDTSKPLSVGQTLKVVRGPFSAFVELGQSRLTLWLNGRYAGRFNVTPGQDAPVTDGEFAVLDKVENPTYLSAAGTIAPGDPQNPLGRFWLDLGNRMGIHASREANSQDPRGYYRMAPPDAEDVYDILTVGSRVYIQR